MGIDIDSVLIVGLSYEELFDDEFLESHNIDKEEDWEYYDELTRVSPHYDAYDRECLYGINVRSWGNTIEEVYESMQQASDRFTALTGKQGKVYQSQDVW